MFYKASVMSGSYLHRISRKSVHYNRELWLVKGTREVLEKEADGVLILLGGHFEEREGSRLEWAGIQPQVQGSRFEGETARLEKRGGSSPTNCDAHSDSRAGLCSLLGFAWSQSG